MVALAHERCADGALSHDESFNLRYGGHPSPFHFAMSQLYGKLQSQGFDNCVGGPIHARRHHRVLPGPETLSPHKLQSDRTLLTIKRTIDTPSVPTALRANRG